jgi:hypothetical protein
LSIALTPGSRSKFWRMNPSSARRKCEASLCDSEDTSRPPISTAPPVGSSSVAIISSRVVLPDPLGPYNATISPGATDSETPSTARTVSPPTAG